MARPRANDLFTLLIVAALFLPGCAILNPKLDRPTLKVDSLTLGESTGLNQRFRIGLLLANPNSVALPVTGMSYTLNLNGYDLLSGVTNQIPTLAAYSETPVTIEASADLVSALRLINSLASKPQNQLQYQLIAKLDVKRWPLPLNITQAGRIELRE
ncbi:MAG: LEA type 2 family protein [Cellvibrionaceae bacterium]